MLKILQARLQQYVNRELPDVQAGFRKGRGTREQIANIRWIMEKVREFQKNIYFCFIDYAKALWLCGSQETVENSERDGNTSPPDLPLKKPIRRSVQFSSVAQSCPTLCDPMNHSMPGLSVHHQLLKFTQTHVHRVGDAIQPSHPLLSRSPLLSHMLVK